jgi:hypothetical protein
MPSGLGRTVRAIVRNGKCLNSVRGTNEQMSACDGLQARLPHPGISPLIRDTKP